MNSESPDTVLSPFRRPLAAAPTLGPAHWAALSQSRLCGGLPDSDLRQIGAALRVIHVPAGELICRQGEPGNEMYVVVRGRIKISVERGSHEFQLLDYLGPGDHFGEMSLLIERPRSATAAAVLESELLVLERDGFDNLLKQVPGFAANLSRALGFRLHWETSRQKRRHRPAVVGLVHSNPSTERLLAPLAEALAACGQDVLALAETSQLLAAGAQLSVETLPRDPDARVPSATRTAERIDKAIAAQQRVLAAWPQTLSPRELAVRLTVCEEIWWLVEPAEWPAARQRLQELLSLGPHLAARTRLVWFVRNRDPLPPHECEALGIAERDFRIILADDVRKPDYYQRQSIAHLVRHLEGVRVGLALGGGGARGMAHLGVLRALEKENIFFDLVAGTSSGALMGLAYAAGWSPQESLDEFTMMLTPSRWWRTLPWGHAWYLIAKFRTGAWERMLRPYVGETSLKQLRIPLLTTAVDLISGREVVRDSGDAVAAVLESINLPLVSRPILRDGMALIDGGVLNNLPVDVLMDRGADLIVAVDVVSQLEQKFGRNTPHAATSKMRQPGAFATYLRVNEVQDYGITALRTQAADLLIMPDTASFDWSDFGRARALADVGEIAAERAIPQLKELLAAFSAG
ncbi:MAG: cyclic nucleotide-binding and patatin-like phospholipase domain-containing protein [Planctomycetia bacterium]|nr:cyclic nucleotide-binding and patatin-like phospholipase domain-containing protein [Planctomycetia bacterium]